MSGRVPISGFYNILVHHYQPENSEFSADVLIQDGQHYQAKLPLLHCPSTAGCRALVAQEDKNTKFYIQDNFLVGIQVNQTLNSANVLSNIQMPTIHSYMCLQPAPISPQPFCSTLASTLHCASAQTIKEQFLIWSIIKRFQVTLTLDKDEIESVYSYTYLNLTLM